MTFYSAHTEPVAAPIPNDNRPYIAFKHITIDTNKKTNIQFKVPAKFPPMTLSRMDIRSRDRVKALTLLLTLSLPELPPISQYQYTQMAVSALNRPFFGSVELRQFVINRSERLLLNQSTSTLPLCRYRRLPLSVVPLHRRLHRLRQFRVHIPFQRTQRGH